jgi:hypothetical protein
MRENRRSEGTTRLHSKGRLVHVGNGVYVFESVGIDFDSPELPWRVDLEAKIIGERYEVTRLSFARREGDDAITGENLRRVAVGELASDLLSYAATRGAQTKKSPHLYREKPTRPRPSDDATLEYVARIYRLAYVTHSDPAKAVAQNLELPPATASRWIRRAREEGHLTETAPRRKKGAR